MPTQNRWNEHWMRVAWLTSSLSKDPATKVGAVVVTPDNRQISIGYNGFAAGFKETPENWERPRKYELAVHGELNAILNCPFPTKGCSVYITHQPCHRCIAHLRNAGISKIFYNQTYSKMGHQDIWDETAKLFDEVTQLHGEYHNPGVSAGASACDLRVSLLDALFASRFFLAFSQLTLGLKF